MRAVDLSAESTGAVSRALLFVLAAACLASCSGTQLQSLPDTPLGPGYRIGMQLELRAERMLERPPGTLSQGPPNLVREPMSAEPASLGDFRRNSGAYPNIIGVLPAGTRLEVAAIERRTYPGLEPWYEVRARVIDGLFAGRLVSPDKLSKQGPDRTLQVDLAEFRVLP